MLSAVLLVGTYVVKFRDDFENEQVQKSGLLLAIVFIAVIVIKLLSK